MNKFDIFNRCVAKDNTIALPDEQLDRKLYKEVANAFEGLGGKWNRKVNAFVFSTDATVILEELQSGKVTNLKKEFQFFATPKVIAEQLVHLADLKPKDKVLEPSAGQGAIIDAILAKNKEQNILAIELMQQNSLFLEKYFTKENRNFKNGNYNFLEIHTWNDYGSFDKIIANPPFTKNQDVDHVLEMWKFLREGGRIVSVMSNSWRTGSQKKQIAFREFIDSVDSKLIELPSGTFKESGTQVASCILILNK